MNDPIGTAARAAAQQLQVEAGPGLLTEVEAVLAIRESPSAPPQYVDPVALASLIVGIGSLAWTVYTDLKKRTAKPSTEVVARTVRVARRDEGQADAPDHIVEVVVTEVIRAADQREFRGLTKSTRRHRTDPNSSSSKRRPRMRRFANRRWLASSLHLRSESRRWRPKVKRSKALLAAYKQTKSGSLDSH